MPRNKNSSVTLSSVIERLQLMKLSAMADQLAELDNSRELYSKSSLEVMDKLITAQEINDLNSTVARYKKQAGLYYPQADLTNVLYKPERHINAALVEQLSTNEYIRNSLNVMIMSATGGGKTFFASAFGNRACEDRFTVRYFTMQELFYNLHRVEEQSCLNKTMMKLGKVNLIIIDDFLLTSVTKQEAEYLYSLFNQRPYKGRPRSFIVCSQLMKEEMYTRLSTYSSSLSDAIMDRLTAKAYQLEIQGNSMREANISADLEQQRGAGQ